MDVFAIFVSAFNSVIAGLQKTDFMHYVIVALEWQTR